MGQQLGSLYFRSVRHEAHPNSLSPPLCCTLAAPKLWQILSEAPSFTVLFGADRIKVGRWEAGEGGETAKRLNRWLFEPQKRKMWGIKLKNKLFKWYWNKVEIKSQPNIWMEMQYNIFKKQTYVTLLQYLCEVCYHSETYPTQATIHTRPSKTMAAKIPMGIELIKTA